ncbi:MAG: hypothetical protein RLZZ606_238 [Actinomycetota bacterium]
MALSQTLRVMGFKFFNFKSLIVLLTLVDNVDNSVNPLYYS